MQSIAPIVSRSERALARSACRASSTGVTKTPEQVQQSLERQERGRRMAKFLQRPANTRMTQGVGSGADLHVPKNIAELAVLNGMPAVHANRTVTIAQRALKTVQSGQSHAHQWQITWASEERWKNPLMGWTSSADPMSQVHLYFDSKEEAIGFAERNNWKFEILRETDKSTTPLGYTQYKDNFLTKRTALEVKRDGPKNTIFANPNYGKSHWFMPLKYHGDGEVRQHGPSHATAAN